MKPGNLFTNPIGLCKKMMSALVSVAIIGATSLPAQTSRIEALKKTVSETSAIPEKLDAVLALCDQAHSLAADTLLYYASLANQLAVMTHDPLKIALSHTYLETWLGRKNLFDSALKICDADLIGLSYVTAGNVYAKVVMQKCNLLMKSNRHKLALDEAYHFLQEAENRGDTLSQVYAKYIVGCVYRNMQQTEEALTWFNKADQTSPGMNLEKEKNEFGIYFLIGMMYNWKADAEVKKKERNFDSLMSVSYLDKSIADSRRYENLGILARSLCIKADGIEDPKQLPAAGAYLKEAIHIYDQMRDTVSILNSLTSMSNYYMSIGQPEKGIAACEQGIEMIRRGNAFPLVDFYYTLGQCYKTAGHMEKYAETLNIIINLKDTTYKKNSENDLAELNAKYEKQKSENIIIQQKLDLTKKSNLVYGTLILLGITLLVSYGIFQARAKNQQLKLQQVVIDQKKKITEAVLQAEENERKRIAADLHDSVAQKMFVAKLNLETFEDALPSLNAEQQQLYNNIFSLVDDSCSEVRTISHSMMPQAFFKSGLTEAVQNMIDQLEYTNLHISFSTAGELETLNKNMEIMIFRIIQECMQNIIKHASAKHVDLSIIHEKKEINIMVEDDGVGFNPSSPDAREGMGLKNIRSRVDFLNGELDISSGPGKGTVVAIHLANQLI